MKIQKKTAGKFYLFATIWAACASGMSWDYWSVDGSPSFFLQLFMSVAFAYFAYMSLTKPEEN